MQVNPVSRQPVATQPDRPAPKALKDIAQQLAPKADAVVLSEKAKDLAAQQAGKGAVEELHESTNAKQLEANAAGGR